MANSGIEIEIYKDTAPFDKIGIIERRKNPTILREVRADGAGSFMVRKNDPKVVADPTLLDYNNFVRVRVNGVVAGGFIMQTKKHVIVGEGEAAEEMWSIAGEGLRAWSKGSRVQPKNGVSAYSRETRYFNFASEQGSWYNPGQWVNATVTWSWNQAGNWWGTAPSDWPDAPNAKWIWDRGNGSYSMPNGQVYLRKEFTLAEAGQYSLFFAVDDHAEVYMDGEKIFDTAEHSWQETNREDVDLAAGNHVLAFKATQNVTASPGSVIAAFYKIGNASSPTAAVQMFVSDTSWKVCGYPGTEPGWTIGNILLTLMDEAEARGARWAANVTPTWTAIADSAGTNWGGNVSVNFDIGATYAEVFEAMEGLGCDVYLDPDNLNLHAYKVRGVDRSIEGTVTDPIILRVGHNLRTADEAGQADIVNTLILKAADGWTVHTNPASITKYGVVEGQVSTDLTTAAAAPLIAEIFAKKALPEKTATFELIPVPNMVPWDNFTEADYVSAPGEVAGVLEKRRIMSISLTENEANGDPIYAIEFDAIFGDRTEDLVKSLSRQAHASALGAEFTNTTGTPSTVTQGSNPALPVSAAPVAPTGLVVSTVGRWAANGAAVSDYGLTWNAVIANSNSLPVSDIESYEVWGRRDPDTLFRLMATVFDTFAYLKDFNPGDTWGFRVRAISRTGGPGPFSTTQSLLADAPVVPLGTPSTPTLVSELGSVVIKWDGLIGGATPPNRFKYMKVTRSTSAGGTYTMVTSFTGGSATDASGVVGTTYWYKLVPVDYLGVEGTPSTAASIAVAGVSTAELDTAVNDAINGAVSTANSAITAANGKNKITYSTSTPGATAGIAGDTWYRRDGTGKVIAIYENTGGSTWVQRTLTEGSIQDISAGVLTTGFLASERIAASSIQATKLLIGDFTNHMEDGDFEVGSWTLTPVFGAVAYDTVQKYSGTRSLKFSGQSAAQYATAAARPINVLPGERYRMSWRVRRDAAATINYGARMGWNAGAWPAGPGDNAYSFLPVDADPQRPNRWLRVRYPVNTPVATTPPVYNDIRTITPVAASADIPDAASLAENLGDSYIGLLRTIVYVDTARTIAFTALHDDAGRVYVDGTSVYSSGAYTASASISFPLTMGWHVIDLLWDERSGGDGWSGITPILGTQVTKMFAPTYGEPVFDFGTIAADQWINQSFEVVAPAKATIANPRFDVGGNGGGVWIDDVRFTRMTSGQLLVDGTIQGRHVAANTIEGESMKIGTIAVDRLEPNAGASLDLAANGSINLILGTTAAQAETLTQQQAQLAQQEAATTAAQLAANNAATTANNANTTASGLQAGIQSAQADLAALGMTYRFTPTAAIIGSPGSPYEFVIQNVGAEIRHNGVPTTSWDAGRMISPSFVGSEVVLGSHKLEADDAGTGTVVRKL